MTLRFAAACAATGLLLAHAIAQERAAPMPLLEMELRAHGRTALAKHLPGVGPAVENGLRWLSGQQSQDGSWDADDLGAAGDDADGRDPTWRIAVSGLVLFALAREGPADERDAQREPLLRGARWLMTQQPNDVIGDPGFRQFVYGHAIGTLGLCAATAATGDEACRDAAGTALRYLERHRNPYAAWRYQPRDNDNDASVTAWAVLANLAANDIGLEINGNALLLARYFLQQVSDDEGHSGYVRRGERGARAAGQPAHNFPPERDLALTAASLMCRLASGEPFAPAKSRSKALPKSLAAILDVHPEWSTSEADVDLCHWFFTAEALRRLDAQNPEPARERAQERRQFRERLAEALIKGQRGDGAFAGSWDPNGPWGERGGRIYATTMAVLALQALYRLPEPPKAPAHK